jgi:hypothetical protein
MELMRRDVFPAEVSMPDGTFHRGVRVFITSERLIAVGEGFERVVDERLTDPSMIQPSRETLPLSGRLECHLAGGVAWVNRGGGCSCHDPRKALATPVPWASLALA